MAEGLNRVMLIGNVGQEPVLRSTQSGQSVLSLRIATNERYKDRDDVWQERTEWHGVVVWGKRAEGLAKILTKGDRIYVEGRLQTREWEKDGIKRHTTEIVVQSVLLLGGKPRDTSTSQAVESQQYMRAPANAPSDTTFSDDDIPFSVSYTHLTLPTTPYV